MHKGSLNKFLKGNATNRIPKIATLAITTSVLLAMVNIDASAGNNRAPATSPRSSVVLALESQSSNSQFSGLIRKWRPKQAPTTTTTTTPASNSPAGGGGGGGGTPSTTTTTDPPSTTTTTDPPPTTTTTDPSTPATTGGLISAGPSRDNCLVAAFDASSLSALHSAVNSFESLTGSTVTCVGTYLDTAKTWTDWADPWLVGPSGAAFTSWVAENPQVNQLVIQVDLIPASLENQSDPLAWEQSCANGDFNSHATELGTELVAAGLQNSVLRLGAEMNGPWEVDFMGTTTQEQNLWAQCFANEVTGLRAATGEHFLIDWNPNACYQNVPFANFYPGNSSVDIMGLDLYDVGCDAPTTALTFSQLANEPDGLTALEAFATAQGKPMSFPEWGLESTPSGDDAGYMDGIGSAVDNGDFAFQEYFDIVVGNTILLGTNTPLSNGAYQKYFGNS